MVRFKEKFVGIILIVLGLFPLLNGIKFVADYFSTYTWMSYFNVGGVVYQFVIIIFGIILVWEGRRFRRGYY